MTEIDLTPITRLEYDIDAILNDHAVAEPITRIELILADIVAGNTTTVEPVTRIETYLAIISGADYPVPEPVTRIETFLAIIAGEDYEEPEAVTRLEGLLAEWVEKGSGIWKTVTGTLIHITDALASPVKELSVAIEPQQSGSGDPSPTNVRPITGWTGCNINVSGADTSNPTVYPISWQTEAGTVYGGTLTINQDGSVDLVADKVELTFDGSSDESWKFVSASRKFAECSSLTLDIKYTDGDAVPPIISNIAVSVPRNATYSAITYAAVSANDLNTKTIRFLYAGVTDTLSLANFKTWLSNNNLQVVYEIAEPVTYHLESIAQISTLAGENNIWADVNGTITLTYKEDGRYSDIVGIGKADFMILQS